MIQIEFLGPSGGAARPAAARANDADAASFLNVFARGEGETAQAQAQAPAEPVERDPDTAESEATDLVADDAGEEAELLVGAGGDDLLTAHDDRIAAAIAAADPGAAAAAGQALSAAGMDPAMAGEAEASGDAEGRTPPIAERGVFPEGAPKAGGALSVRPADAQFVGRASAIPPGGVAIDPASNPGGGETIAVQVGPGAGVRGVVAMPAQGGQPGGDLRSTGTETLAARSQGRAADGPDLAKAMAEGPGTPGFSDVLSDESELPVRIAAFPARLTGESAAPVMASPASAPAVLAGPDPALAGMAVAQGAAAAEAAETSAVQAGGDEVALAPSTSTSSSPRTAYPLLFAAAEPQRVTRQIAEAVRQGSDGSIELALSPKELGSVRMSIHATETGTAIMMSAERDETMQLLRRHAEMLHEAFRELGLGTLDLSFGGREGQGAQQEPRGSDATGLGAAAPAETADILGQRSPRMAGGGLDLRM